MSVRPPAPSLDGRLDGRPVVAIFRSPLFNASETFVQNQAAALRRYQPLVVGLENKGHAFPQLADRLVLPRSGAERLAFKLLGRTGAMAARLRAHRPALVHAHFGTDGLLALPLAEALGIPLATTLHGYDVSRSRREMLTSRRLSWTRYGLFQRRLMRRGTLFLAVSEALRRRALAAGYPPERTLTHYMGVDLTRFRSGREEAEPGLVLHVGRLVEKKGTSFLLQAFERVRASAPTASLAIIGDGPLRQPLERQAAPLGACVRFLGARPPGEIAAWMRRASLLAVPSVTASDGDAEGLPTVILEAAASSLPVVGTDHAGIPEAVVDGRTGFLVPERDPAAFASRLLAILGNPALRLGMAAAARALAETRFDAVRQTQALEDHYDRLVRAAR